MKIEKINFQNLNPLVETMRIVGLGENAHFVQEFNYSRIELVKYLAPLGFTHVALEIGAIEASRINPWLQGDGNENDLLKIAGSLTYGLYRDFLIGLRAFNRICKRKVHLLGPDLPNNMDVPAEVNGLIAYLEFVDPDSIGLIVTVQEIASKISYGSAAIASQCWANIAINDQLTLIANLARMSQRMNIMKPFYVAKSNLHDWTCAQMHLEAAYNTVHMLCSLSELFSGTGLLADTSIREQYTATSMLKILSSDPSIRILYVAHNNHIQKEPIYFGDHLTAFPTGYYLKHALDEEYMAIGLIHSGKNAPEMIMDADHSSVGFRVEMLELDLPPTGSVERLIIKSGFSDQYHLLDLSFDNSHELNCIRSQSAFINTPIAKSFDAIWHTPTATQVENLSF
ncbi:MAG: erythromycin esterase family protein [Oligoflexales bacterium]|nr:erythromycin esterase family protein [Oligoflexales bacterium]